MVRLHRFHRPVAVGIVYPCCSCEEKEEEDPACFKVGFEYADLPVFNEWFLSAGSDPSEDRKDPAVIFCDGYPVCCDDPVALCRGG